MGWICSWFFSRPFVACPKCGGRNLFPPQYEQSNTTEVECIYFDKDDLEEESGAWYITESDRNKLDGQLDRQSLPLV